MKHLLAILLILSLTTFLPALSVTNPLIEVTDDDVFEDLLQIEIDADELPNREYHMAVISGEIGQILFDTADPDGAPVSWCFRFTRNEGYDGDIEAFAGICATDFTEGEPFDYTFTEPDDDDKDDTVTVTVRPSVSAEEATTVYFWAHRGVFYTLSMTGVPGEMLQSEVFDSVMAACFD